MILAAGEERRAVHATFQDGGDDAVSDSGGGNYTLDARSNWYPNSTFGDRATYEMTIITNKDLIMVATGHLWERQKR